MRYCYAFSVDTFGTGKIADEKIVEIVKKVLELSKKHNTKLFGLVSNMSIAAQRRDFLQHFDYFICNRQEFGILFSDDYSNIPREELKDIISDIHRLYDRTEYNPQRLNEVQ